MIITKWINLDIMYKQWIIIKCTTQLNRYRDQYQDIQNTEEYFIIFINILKYSWSFLLMNPNRISCSKEERILFLVFKFQALYYYKQFLLGFNRSKSALYRNHIFKRIIAHQSDCSYFHNFHLKISHNLLLPC